MTNEDKLREIFPKTIFLQHIEGDKITALVCSDEWLNAEYQEPTPKNDLGVDAVSRADARSLICKIDIKHHLSGMSRKAFKDLYNGIDELPSVAPQLSSGLEKDSQKLENPTKKYCGCCTHWKRKGVKKIGDKPTSYGKCTKLSISGFDVETEFNDDCSSEGLE